MTESMPYRGHTAVDPPSPVSSVHSRSRLGEISRGSRSRRNCARSQDGDSLSSCARRCVVATSRGADSIRSLVNLPAVEEDRDAFPRRSFVEPLGTPKVGGLGPGQGSLEKRGDGVVLPTIRSAAALVRLARIVSCPALHERANELQERLLVVNAFGSHARDTSWTAPP
jgi:hypothetical protein